MFQSGLDPYQSLYPTSTDCGKQPLEGVYFVVHHAKNMCNKSIVYFWFRVTGTKDSVNFCVQNWLDLSEFALIYFGTLFLWLIVKNQSVCPLRPCWEQNERNFLIYPTMSQGGFCFWHEIEDSCPVQLQFPDYRQFTLEANLAKGQSDWIAYLPIYQAVHSDLIALPHIFAE